MWSYCLVVALHCLVLVCGKSISHNKTIHETNESIEEHHDGHHGIALASWRWDEYSDYFIICVMISMAAAAKVIFHEIPYLSKHFPESCALIVLGQVLGSFVYYGVESHSHHFPE